MPNEFPAAVLWDMDGTLVDTEPYWFKAEHRLVDAEGNGKWSDELAAQVIGFDLLDCAKVLRDRGGVDLEPSIIVERLLADVIAQLEVEVPWRPGARELLDQLRAAGVPCALVTMSWRSFADAVLAHLPGVFDAVVVGDEVPDGRGKPDPLPYEMGAAKLGVAPHECVAIEDSLTGSRSAVAAGCGVLVVPNAHTSVGYPDEVHLRPSLAEVSLGDLATMQSSHHESN